MTRVLAQGVALAAAAILASCISWGGAAAQTADIAVAPGRLLGATRFQLAWLDWDAPRPVFLTALANPAVAHDVAALPGVSTALVSVSKPATDGRNWGIDPSDILGVDLTNGDGQRVQPRPVLLRADPAESLSWPTWWPDGSAFVFQREDEAAPAVQSPDGFARPPARIEIAPRDNPAQISSLQDLARPGVKVVGAQAAVPIGAYTSQLLQSASANPTYGPDFQRRVEANLVSREDTVRQIVAKIQLGEADAAVVYVTDVTAQIADHFVRIPLPDDLQVTAQYPIAVGNGHNRAGGEAFVAFIQSPPAQQILARWGFISLPEEGG